MNLRDDCAEPLFAMDFCERVRSHVYGRLSKDSLRTKEQARARQYLCIMRVNDLPLLPPAGVELETSKVLKKAIAASRALAELKGLGGSIPNQAMLINTITLQEARTSSEIENIVTTQDALYQAFTAASGKVRDPATKEVLRYREAMWDSFNALQKRPLLTTNLFIRIVTVSGFHNLIWIRHSGKK